ncbi:hypothetical protein GCM10008983_13230 [Lentibacillus halophilus]|uniref:Plasmid segregation centromere-binding protein ParR n=1 Tax=Lentibacillus halophilus TaxID=295065 RepID=A0ABP3J1T9_9BACI
MERSKKRIERGQSITFRIPSDTPDYLLKQLQKIKDQERRNFSSQMAQYVLKGVQETFTRERESVTVPLPRQLTQQQKNWLKHEHSEALIGNIVYQLMQDPVRATSVLATLSGNQHPVDDAPEMEQPDPPEPPTSDKPDLDAVEMNELDSLHDEGEADDQEEDDPLADFFSKMNK